MQLYRNAIMNSVNFLVAIESRLRSCELVRMIKNEFIFSFMKARGNTKPYSLVVLSVLVIIMRYFWKHVFLIMDYYSFPIFFLFMLLTSCQLPSSGSLFFRAFPHSVLLQLFDAIIAT